MLLKTRLAVVQEAIEVVLRHLERLPPSEKLDELRPLVRDCMREAKRWATSPPIDREQDVLMTRILALHVEVTKLERQGLLATKIPHGCVPAPKSAD